MRNDLIINEFLEALIAEKYVSFNTSSSYRYDIENLSVFLKTKNLSIIEVVEDDLRSYIKNLRERNYKIKTILRKISSIKSLFRFLYSEQKIASDPSVNLECPKSSLSLPQSLTFAEINQLLKTISADCSAKGVRLKAIITVLYSSGMRISELINLKIKEIDAMLKNKNLDFHHIVIRGKGEKDRLIILNKLAIDSIVDYCEVRKSFINDVSLYSQWVFPGKKYDQPITRQRILQLLKSLAVRANIAVNKISPHKLRHSFATHMLNNGASVMSIQKMLGHSTLATTQIYTHVANDKLKNELSKSHPLAKPQFLEEE